MIYGRIYGFVHTRFGYYPPPLHFRGRGILREKKIFWRIYGFFRNEFGYFRLAVFRVRHAEWTFSAATRRASKSPDLAGDLPIFDSNDNLPISRFGMKISRFITRDSRLALSIANFAIAVGETTFSLANVVKNRGPIWRKELLYSVIEKIKRVWRPRKPPYSSRHRTGSYMLWKAWEASLSCYAWPSLIRPLATPASEKEGFPETRHRNLF